MGKALIIGIGAVLAVNFTALAFHLYPRVTWLDSALHFLGGALMAALFFWFFNRERLPAKPVYKIILAVSFVMLIGVLWEFAEYTFLNALMDFIFGAEGLPATMSDTMADLFLDLLGSAVFAVIYYRHEIRNSWR